MSTFSLSTPLASHTSISSSDWLRCRSAPLAVDGKRSLSCQTFQPIGIPRGHNKRSSTFLVTHLNLFPCFAPACRRLALAVAWASSPASSDNPWAGCWLPLRPSRHVYRGREAAANLCMANRSPSKMALRIAADLALDDFIGFPSSEKGAGLHLAKTTPCLGQEIRGRQVNNHIGA